MGSLGDGLDLGRSHSPTERRNGFFDNQSDVSVSRM